FFVKSADQMAQIFPDRLDVLERTQAISERCNLKLNKVENPFPEFAVPEGHTIDSYFEEICREGYRKRLATGIAHLQSRGQLRFPIHDYEARLEREIDTIKQMK